MPEIDLKSRMGFSDEVLQDCGADSPPEYQRWLQEKRRTKVPTDEFWFYVNNILPGSEPATVSSVRARLGSAGQHLRVRILSRL